jgi:peptidoglycan/LPS O-acetylase OafA/YrhL
MAALQTLAVPEVHSTNENTFRRDINGLRAWAVVGVVLYHFRIPGFDGGFAGVDVFFVISGFLMTQIICKALARGDFSLPGFYLARAVRIVPALVTLCGALLAAGWFSLLPPDYKTLGSHTAYSLSFLSNIEYWLEAGYFDTSSHEKWLLHTWSLSVEWQFYLVLPIILMGLWRLEPGLRAQRKALLVLGCASLAACIWTTGSNPSTAFFLLHTRAWEMLAGGIVFLLGQSFAPPSSRRRLFEALGLALIAASFIFFDAESSWPGWRAMVPVSGAVLVLMAARSSPWTGNRFAQWLGDRSYSLYLWHWPVQVGLAYAGWTDNGLAIAAGLVGSTVLGALSYAWIEGPARRMLHGRRFNARTLALGAVVASIALCATGVWFLKGVKGRFAPDVELAAAAADDVHPRRSACHQTAGASSPACVFGGTERKLFVVGDSHVPSIISSVVLAREGGDAGVVQLSYDGCVFIPAMRQLRPQRFGARNDCKGFNDWVVTRLAAEPTLPVLLVGRYARSAFGPFERDPDGATPEVYFTSQRHTSTTPAFLHEFGQHLTDTACKLAKTRTVYMMRPIPEMPVHVPRYVARKMAWGMDASLSVTKAQYMQRNAWVWQAQDEARDRCGIIIIDPTTQLCRNGVCQSTHAGRPLYYDYGHLNEYGARLLAPIFVPAHRSPAGP